MARHVKSWVAVLVSLTIAGILGAWAVNTVDEKVIDDFTKQHSGDIEVTFSIRSADGEPLNRVRVRMTKSRLADAMGRESEPDRFVVDSEFSVKERGVSAIHLLFTKDGYYEERWEFAMSQRPPESFGELHQIDVTVLMTPHPIPAPLERYEGGLRANRDGPLAVFYPTKRRLPNRKPPNHEVSVLPKEDVSYPYLYLSADVGPDGRLATTLFPLKSYSVPKPVLSRGFLRIAGPTEGDGFLPVDIGKIPSIIEHGFRHLLRAPENFYSGCLELAPVEGNEKQFFYCRIGGRFGKGVVTNPPLILEKDGSNFAIASAIIFLNPHGSTDVSYVHY
jgi:hypothetical protein